MKIAIISDTHDSLVNIKRALDIAVEKKCNVLIHCGDICSPETLAYIVGHWRGELHYCLGNMDSADFASIGDTMGERVHFHGEGVSEVDVGGRRIAFQHYPEIARGSASSDLYDAVFYGHTHKRHSEYIGETLLANPGNVCGVIESPGFAVYRTDENDLIHFDL